MADLPDVTRTPSGGKRLLDVNVVLGGGGGGGLVPQPGTAAVTQKPQSNVGATFLALNANRLGFCVANDPTSTDYLVVRYGGGVAINDYTLILYPGQSLEVEAGERCYTGEISGVWASAGAGFASITELTA